jgi:hypothetical protein
MKICSPRIFLLITIGAGLGAMKRSLRNPTLHLISDSLLPDHFSLFYTIDTSIADSGGW